MKYLIFFLSLFISTGISAQLELDPLPPLILGIGPVTPLQYIQESMYSDSAFLFGGDNVPRIDDTSTYILQEYTKPAYWVMTLGPVIAIEGETKVTGVCQIIEDGIIRYGLMVEISSGEGTMLAIFPLPISDNSLWEQLVKQK